MAFGIIAVSASAVSAGVGVWQANKNRQAAKDQADKAKIEREKQQALLDQQKSEYMAQKFTNPFANMENTFEDLTVNQQQAEFQAQQGQQQRANIMQGMRGAAGSSGIAGLAQALANQGALQTQKISADIGRQEAANQMAAAKGAAAVQTYGRQGEQWVQQAEMDRQSTVLGMQFAEATGANVAEQQAIANQMNAQMALTESITSGIGSIGTTAIGAGKEDMFPGQR